MNVEVKPETILYPKNFMNVMIRLGLLVFLAFLSMRVLSPFLTILVWGMFLAIMLYPLHQYIAKRLGGKQGTTAVLLVLFGFILIGVPLIMMGDSLSGHMYDLQSAYKNKTLSIQKPSAAVAEWPIVGERLYNGWNEAATDLPMFLEERKEQIKVINAKILSAAKDTVGSIFQFIGALVIAGIMMAWGAEGGDAMRRILNRIAGPVKGPELQHLTVATVRSVATGVLGIAYIQGMLFGLGFILAGVPAAGVLAFLIMCIAIIQLPTAIIALPVVIYIWSTGDSSLAANIFYTIYFVLVGLADNVLKPLLLGRGVDAPMPVILIGALGGLVVSGLIGLFLGAVLLAVAYQIFWYWVDDPDEVSVS